MARKPNYSFERNNRAKAKAAKREAKRLAKAAAREKKAGTKPVETTAGASSPENAVTEDGVESQTDGSIQPSVS